MEGEVIKSFLVGLGFGVDEKSLEQFNKSILSASLRITALYATVSAAAIGIFKGISGISEGFEQMGYELRLISPAVNKWLVLRQAMLEAYSKAGVNLTKVVQQSILFNLSLTKTKFALEAVFKSVAARFFPLLTKQMDIFRKNIYANMPKIQKTLESFVKIVFKTFQILVELGSRLWSILTRVWDFFERLDKATDGWSTKILLAIAAWKLLNLAFLATPLGMILTGLLAILALFDDFETWKEGGKSLFDWSAFVPVIDAVGASLKTVWNIIGDVASTIDYLVVAIFKLFTLDFSDWATNWNKAGNSIIALFQDLIQHFMDMFNVAKAVIGWLPAAGAGIANLFGGKGAGAGAASSGAVAGVNNPSPLLPNQNSSQQNVNQQTTINVNGAADANSVGKSVAGNQDRVNFDMVRNMKGALQ